MKGTRHEEEMTSLLRACQEALPGAEWRNASTSKVQASVDCTVGPLHLWAFMYTPLYERGDLHRGMKYGDPAIPLVRVHNFSDPDRGTFMRAEELPTFLRGICDAITKASIGR